MKSEKEKNKGITWDEYMLSDVIYVNPQRKLEKNRLAKYVPMEVLLPFKKYIESYYTKIFNGGIKFKNKDIIMAKITPCLENGKVAYINFLGNDEVAFGSTEYIVFCEKENLTDSEYIYYLIISPEFRRITINSMTGTSGRQRVQTDILKKMKILLPSLTEQKQIGKILSSVDEKIELNNKINNTLEQISQLLFKHWFVDFEFPNEQGKPYKSTGGEFVDSKLGKIPKGWKICKLLDCGEIICGKTPPKSNKNYFGGNIPFIKIPDMHNNVFILKTVDSLTEKGKKFQENKTISAKSIIVSCIATVGLVSITSSESQTNQQINSLIPLYEPSLYYLYFKLKTLKDYFNTLGGSGSTTLNVNTKIFSNVKVIMPTNIILEKFNKVVSTIFNSILLNSRENLNLSQIRDTLLPKLITGKIRVNLKDIKES